MKPSNMEEYYSECHSDKYGQVVDVLMFCMVCGNMKSHTEFSKDMRTQRGLSYTCNHCKGSEKSTENKRLVKKLTKEVFYKIKYVK
jgi:hypothetical protein